MDTATQQQQGNRGFDPGAEESTGSNRIFVSLRTGKICQHSRDQLSGYKPAQTKNKDGSVNNFFAKEYDHLTGYVTDIRWHTHTLPDGTVLAGWNVTIDTTKEVFVLQIGMNDRPFERFMNVMLGVDFERPVRFVAFMGKSKTTQKSQKVLLVTQEQGPDNKPIWLKPTLDEKWLSREIINKLKEKLPLTEAEERNVSRLKDGSFNKDYPYVTQGVDGKWSLEILRNFLHEQMLEHVIPSVTAANEARGPIAHVDGIDPALEDAVPEFSGPAAPPDNDDIPF